MDPARTCHSRPTLIGGASRSGKTLLASALQESSGPVAGFPLEGVFHVYNRRTFPFFKIQRQRILCEYLSRPRYITGDRLQTASPQDYMDHVISKMPTTIPSSITHQISLLGWIMDQFANHQECTSWAVFDLHPEFFFEKYRKFIPDLRLAIMRRNPYSAIAAGMFWRSWPEAPPDRKKRFRLMLALWYLSNIVAESLLRKYPGAVSGFSFDGLCNSNRQELSKLTTFFPVNADEIKKSFNFVPHFRFSRERGFLNPAGKWEELLTVEELKKIEAVERGIVSDPLIRSLLTFGAQAPSLTRQMLEAYLYPVKSAHRRWNAVKQLLIDVHAGVRLRLEG